MTDIGKLLLEANTKGGEFFYSPIFGRLIFSKVIISNDMDENYDICLVDKAGLQRRFDRYGRYRYHGLLTSEDVMLFPSKDVKWNRFGMEFGLPAELEEHQDLIKYGETPVSLRVYGGTDEVRSFGLTSAQWDVLDEFVATGSKRVCGYHIAKIENVANDVLSKTKNQDLIDFVTDCKGLGGEFYFMNKDENHVGLVAVLRNRAA